MQINDLVTLQAQFDSERSTTFDWDEAASADNLLPLLRSALALAGEVGEVANLVKKADRGDLEYDSLVSLLSGELADVLAYTLKLAHAARIDIEKSFEDKMVDNANRFPPSQVSAPGQGMSMRLIDLKRQTREVIVREVKALVSGSSFSPADLIEFVRLYAEAAVPSRSLAQEQVAGAAIAVALGDVFPPSAAGEGQLKALLSAGQELCLNPEELRRLSTESAGFEAVFARAVPETRL